MPYIMCKQTLIIKRNVYICAANLLKVNNGNANARRERVRGLCTFCLSTHSRDRQLWESDYVTTTPSRRSEGCFPAPETRRSTLWPHLACVTSSIDNSVCGISDSHVIIKISPGIRRRSLVDRLKCFGGTI